MTTQIELFVREAMTIHDAHADRHGPKVAEWAMLIGMDIEEPVDFPTLSMAANLHDLGKLFIPETIINKISRLNALETSTIQLHPSLGYRAVQTTNLPQIVRDVILCHHENWDGSGYPQGLLKTNIPLYARIIRIADSIDAMLSDRPYRPPQDIKSVKRQIEQGADSLYDPRLAVCAAKVLETWIQTP